MEKELTKRSDTDIIKLSGKVPKLVIKSEDNLYFSLQLEVRTKTCHYDV
jgi:hypothetical protein